MRDRTFERYSSGEQNTPIPQEEEFRFATGKPVIWILRAWVVATKKRYNKMESYNLYTETRRFIGDEGLKAAKKWIPIFEKQIKFSLQSIPSESRFTAKIRLTAAHIQYDGEINDFVFDPAYPVIEIDVLKGEK